MARTPFLALGILFLIPAAAQHPQSNGSVLLIATTEPCGNAGRGRDIIVRAQSHGELRINDEYVKPENLSRRLQEIFEYGVPRYLFVAADPQVPLKNVTDLIGILSKDFSRFAILAPFVEGRLVSDRSLCLGPRSPAV